MVDLSHLDWPFLSDLRRSFAPELCASGKRGDLTSDPAQARAECKACIAAAERAGRDGYVEELEATRRLFQHEDTRLRVQAFLAESSKTGRQTQRAREAAL